MQFLLLPRFCRKKKKKHTHTHTPYKIVIFFFSFSLFLEGHFPQFLQNRQSDILDLSRPNDGFANYMFTFNYKRNDKAKVTENPKLSFNSKRDLVTLRYIAVNPFSALGVFLIHREPMLVLFFQKLARAATRHPQGKQGSATKKSKLLFKHLANHKKKYVRLISFQS